MGIRSSLTVENAMLAALWAGLVSFVVLHSLALLQGAGEQTLPMFRKLWFLGIGLTVALVAAARYLW